MRRLGTLALVLGLIAVIGAAGFAGTSLLLRPGSSPPRPGEVLRSLGDVVQSLPEPIKSTLALVAERFERAQRAFRDARLESERSLVSQLQEAKQRGSVPPV
jgi:hypothetical protein